ncbi:MAG: ABC transporter substrate-binding protein, partial [Clostridiales bacterium]|nr:ABC transporter substrate-binding protein [Clostridiales bacterium]
DTLVTLNDSMNIVPMLATDWARVDELNWQFTLRQGVKFHNGEELKALDVAFSFNRLIDPATAAAAAFMLSSVEKTTAIDDYTVQITTKAPFASILYNLTHAACSILNEKAVTAGGDNYGQNPVGTGAFKFVRWAKNQAVTLEKFQDYYAGPAAIDEMVIRFIPESATAVAELQTGGVDIVLNVPPQYRRVIENEADLKIDSISTFIVKYIAFDHRKAPFDDIRVRQAVNYATDNQAIINVAYEGNAQQLTGPLAPLINGYNPALKGYGLDIEKAKQLMADAGYANGFSTTLYLSDKEEDAKIATVLKEQLKEIGVELELQIIEWGPYLARTAEGVPMFILGWTTVTADADNGMYSNFHSRAWGNQGNRSFYKNAEVDRLLDAARSEFDPAARTKMYQDASALIVEDAVWDFLSVNNYMVGMNKHVTGFKPVPTTLFRFYSIDITK